MPNQPANQHEGDETLHAAELESRRRSLAWIGVASTILSLVVAVFMGRLVSGNPASWGLCVLTAVVLGVFVGLAHAPVLGWTIAPKRFWLALPLIYGGALVICGIALLMLEAVWGIVAFTLAVPLLALSAMRLPDERAALRDRCHGCGYNLAGNLSDACPECGSPLLRPAPKPEAAQCY